MKGLKIANQLAGMASKKEKEKKPSLVIMIGHGKPDEKEEKCPTCGAAKAAPESEEKEES